MVKQQLKHVCCIFTQFINYEHRIQINIIVIIRWKLCLTIFQSMKCTLHPSLSHVWYQGHCSLTQKVGNPKRHTGGESCQTRWGISNSSTLHVHYLLTESTMLHGYLIMMIFNQFNLALAVSTTCNEFFLNPKFFYILKRVWKTYMKDRRWKRIINNRGYLFGTVAKLNKICLNYRGFYFELILSKIPVTYRPTISADDKFEILIVIKFLDLKFDTNWTYLFSYLQMTAISCLQAQM